MTGKERITRILNRQPVDRIGIYEHFWWDTHAYYAKQGKVKENENLDEHFGLDISVFGVTDLTLDIDFENETVAETEDTVTVKDGNGAILKQHKHHSTTPEHIDYTIKTREDWDKVKHMLSPNPRRINFEGYRKAKTEASKAGRYFALAGVLPFECMHRVCGHEEMLVAMIADPEWILDMADTFVSVDIELRKILFEQEGLPDGIWYYEDMGYKEKPFMSPKHYRELIYPSHKKAIDYTHGLGLKVIIHSCGFVEPLLPDMVDAGMDCLQVIEVKAGMDLLRIYRNYGDKIALMGGIDVRALYSNDKAIIDAELEAKIPIVKQGGGYVAHSDHSIPYTVEYDTFRYYIDKVLELGTYK
jgi:uroporphyrinogen decarboxylase